MGTVLQLTEHLYRYVLQSSLREPEIAQRLREETATLPNYYMQLTPDQGQFLALLVQLISAKKTLEVGVFTGYSTLWTALALPPDGRIVACDISEEWTSIARRYWQEAGIASKIDLKISPAIHTLDRLLDEGEEGSFDFAFIDADKPSQIHYYERALQLLRQGGLIVFDNILWSGAVADPKDQTEATRAIRDLTRFIHEDARVSVSLLTVGDGMLLAVKR